MAAADNRITILQLFKTYKGNFPLHNEMVRLDRDRFRLIVCYLGGTSDGKNELESLVSRTEYLGYDSDRLRWYNTALLRRLKALIDEEHVHIVNCQLHRTTPLGVIAARLSASRPIVISTVHGLTTRTSLLKQLQNRIWHLGLHRYVAVSEAVKDSLLAGNPGLSPDKVVTVYNGLDLNRFNSPAEGEKVSLRRELFPGITGDFWFGTAGRLSPVKNHALLLRAFQKVQESHFGCTLLIAGHGELTGELKVLAESLGIGRQVHFLGFRNDLPRVYKTLDGFVFPSLREGLGLALVEAMASGLPFLASRVGGIPEVAGEDAEDLLVPVGKVDELASAMLELLKMPAQRRLAMGEQLRRRALDHFQADRMIRNYELLYESCCQDWSNRNS
ncbi:MAG: glycosyltransferase [Desulfuromonadales bacterium]